MTAVDPKPVAKRKIPDDSNPLLAAATKRMKKEVSLLRDFVVYSPFNMSQANSAAFKRKRARFSRPSRQVLTVCIQTSGKSSQGVCSSFVHLYNAP